MAGAVLWQAAGTLGNRKSGAGLRRFTQIEDAEDEDEDEEEDT